ncbi:MAG: 3-hydroxyacyl-CoA dehydrogenase NAD-binding domain-containing protein [Heliobacteriaceae bacterium]|nr:3-hydroxyacyl-CoA dehydrogenase NAD-binding domain-containing protein [Heliobacteriaceae bacterium]
MVLGAGTMGTEITQVFAESGYPVVLRDIKPAFVYRALGVIRRNLDREVTKGKISGEAKDAALARIQVASTDEVCGNNVDLVVEAIPENLALKRQIYAELDQVCNPKTIFASNTSSLSITALAAATTRPGQVIGMHFFPPVPMMKLVEVVTGAQTNKATIREIKDLCDKLGKTWIEIAETPGFIVNRMLIPMINEAAYILMEGVASAEDIDTAMRLGTGHHIGPLALGDYVGLDVCLAIMETLYAELGDDKYRPCPLLRKLVRADFLGKKTGRGFYAY